MKDAITDYHQLMFLLIIPINIFVDIAITVNSLARHIIALIPVECFKLAKLLVVAIELSQLAEMLVIIMIIVAPEKFLIVIMILSVIMILFLNSN